MSGAIGPGWLPCAKKQLVLFDIDGTLIRCGRQVGPMFLDAMLQTYGTRGDWRNVEFAGKTDGQIVLELLASSGIDRTDVMAGLPSVQRYYLPRIERELDPQQMTLLPGVVRLLEALRAEGVCLGLLTGNWERGGRAKLAPFDLNRFFPCGGFGDDGVARSELPPAAIARASTHFGRSFADEEVLIVGDTLNDIDCARANGLQCLAVATGSACTETLNAGGADWVVPSLERLGSGSTRGSVLTTAH